MRAVNDKLVRLSDVIETVKNQCSDSDNKWGNDNRPRPPYLYIVIDASKAIDALSDIPAVDAVPVVRCKDCKYAHLTYDGQAKYCDQWGTDEALYLDGDFYCAFGERR